MIIKTIRPISPAEKRLMRRNLSWNFALLDGALMRGEVHSFRCKPVRFIEMQYEDAVVNAWIFVGGDGTALYTDGQIIIHEPGFPCQDFELIYDTFEFNFQTIRRHHKSTQTGDEWMADENPPVKIELLENNMLWEAVAEAVYPTTSQYGSQYPVLFKTDAGSSAEEILQSLCAQMKSAI